MLIERSSHSNKIELFFMKKYSVNGRSVAEYKNNSAEQIVGESTRAVRVRKVIPYWVAGGGVK